MENTLFDIKEIKLKDATIKQLQLIQGIGKILSERIKHCFDNNFEDFFDPQDIKGIGNILSQRIQDNFVVKYEICDNCGNTNFPCQQYEVQNLETGNITSSFWCCTNCKEYLENNYNNYYEFRKSDRIA